MSLDRSPADSGCALRIVIPAKNEAARIARTVADCCEYFGSRAKVLLVLNGCTDRTAAVAHELSERYRTLDVLEIDRSIGKGGAVRAGLTFGNEPFVAFADADGSAAPQQIDFLLRQCSAPGVAGAIGSRWLPGARIGRRQPLKRRIASRAFNLLVRGLFGLPFSDTQCGAKVFRREAIEQIFDGLELANFAFDVDLLVTLQRAGRRVVEVPIAWADVPLDSKVSLFGAGLSMLAAVLRLRLRHSPFRDLPFADRLARGSTIPIKPGLEMLMLVDRGGRPAMTAARPILSDLHAWGHRLTVRELRRGLDVLPFYAWYVTFAHRHFDLLIDATDGRLAGPLRFSSKPKIARRALETLPEGTLRAVFEGMAQRCGYGAFLWRSDREWILSSAGASRTVLRGAREP